MSTALVNAISITDAKLWRGGCRIVVSNLQSPPTFPTKLEDVIDPATYLLATGWADFVATSEDGVAIHRDWDDQDGIATDQRSYTLRQGGILNNRMTAVATSLYTDIDTMAYLWQFGAVTTVASGTGVVAHKKAPMGSPTATIERFAAIIQQNDTTNKLRMWVWRKTRLAPPAEMAVQSRNPSRNQFTLRFLPDPSQTDGSDFGWHYEAT